MQSFVRLLQDIGLLIARAIFGAVMVYHGWNRWQGGIQAQADYLTQYGLPEPQLFAWGSVVLEVVGGILMIFGVLTPAVAAVFFAQFLMIVLWVQWRNGFNVHNNGYEYNAILAALSLMFVVFGAGRAGVDNLFRNPRRERASGRVIRDHDPA